MLKLSLLLSRWDWRRRARTGARVCGRRTDVEGVSGTRDMKSDVPSQGNMAMNGLLVSGSRDLNAHFGAKLEVSYSVPSMRFRRAAARTS